MRQSADCKDCAAKLQLYADNELGAAEAAAVQAHAGNCASCRAALDSLRVFSAGLRKHAAYHEAPAGLAAKIAARTGIAKTAPPAWMRFALPSFSAAALALSLALFLSAPSPDNQLVDEAVSIHVRSLMAQHLTDVASTDQHTVKPWFAGRVDFSPPVHDFAKDGYPLIGGRLEYVQHQPAAALVYHRNKHVINVLVTPADDAGDAPMKPASQRGYNLVAWRQNHLSFEAVSDLNAPELMDLCRLISGAQ